MKRFKMLAVLVVAIVLCAIGVAQAGDFTVRTVQELSDAIRAANSAGGSNTITLAPGVTFTLTEKSAYSWGPVGLPDIKEGNNLTIVGSGNIIERSAAKKTRTFGIFFVEWGASLTLTDLTLQGGHSGYGGAINHQGNLTLIRVTLQNNTAVGGYSGGYGGAIYSPATYSPPPGLPPPSLTMQNCIVRNNQVLGLKTNSAGDSGTTVAGGGVFVGSGTASLTNVLFSTNTARGGDGSSGGWVTDPWTNKRYRVPPGPGGDGLGGGMYVERADVTLESCTFESNSAFGGRGSSNGLGYGGGVYVFDRVGFFETALDDFTVFFNNTADVEPDIYGPYTVFP